MICEGSIGKCDVYVPYRKALQECLPPKTVCPETEVRSSLQDMLNISGTRLVLMLILHYGWTPEDVRNLMLTMAWGFDSSAGHNNPHQKCQDKTLESKSLQASLLVTSVTIIELTSLDTGKTWLNRTPQNIRFCHTMRISMEKKSSDAIKNEFDRVEKEKTPLVPYEFKTKDDSDVKIGFYVEHTLFDGKVVNELVGNSSTLRCPMGFKMNKDYKVSGSPCRAHEEKFLKFGPTLLHAELEMYGQLLKLGYLMKIAHSGKESQEQKGNNDFLKLS
ncbi:hypothetical protein QAD02_020742 [Eretmocerus hayati]|uniref:Uncharacterized protein n=1 Tax=Eretmocerus hayati TaxID=131215 RepID=A0ACC2PQT6_9HYME|nr:hypothetical protein QAD02_020742 [Eretmocerus hayati]